MDNKSLSHTKFITYQMEMPVQYSFHSEVPQKVLYE